MSYVPEVTARWKRRATEIADAIGGGESSSTVSGTVSLSAASISALADAIDDRLRLSAIAVSIADVLSVKTNANDSVAVTGTVSATLPANLVIPVDTVAGTNNGANGSGVAVTVPVNAAHNVTIPVKTNSANQPMSSAGLPVSVPVDPVHSVTVPVKSNSSGQPLTLGNVVAQIGVAVGSTTVPVSVVTNTSQGASVYGTGVNVPVAGGLATIPVSNASGLTVQISNASGLVCDIANTNNVVVPVDTVSGTNNAANGSGVAVVVPVTASGTVLDVKLVEVATLAQTSIHEAVEDALNDATGIDINIATVAASAKTQFHEAMETALEEADVVDVNIATIASAAQTDLGLGMRGIVQNSLNTSTLNTWRILVDDGTVTSYDQSLHDISGTNLPGNRRDDMFGRPVYRTPTSYIWRLVVDTTFSDEGIILSGISSTTDYYTWHVVRNGATLGHQRLFETPDSAPYYIMCSSNSVRDSYIGKKVTLYSDDTWLVHA
jgi:hypothetical protein